MKFIKHNRILLLITVISIGLYASFAYDLARSDFVKLFSLYTGLFFLTYKILQISKQNFLLLAGLGILFRLIFIGVLPNLSQDFYRFLWDGSLVLQGINPYLITPETYLESGINIVPNTRILFEGMGALNGSHFSNYPPVNQLCFTIAVLFAGKSIIGSTVALSIIIILADIGILYFGRKLLKGLGIDPHNIYWYFLNPFIIIELTGNLHFEAVMLFFLVWSFYLLHKGKWYWAAVLLGISVSVKLLPLLFLPLLYQWFVKKEVLGRGILKLSIFYLVVLATFLLSFAPFYSSGIVLNFLKTIGLWFQDFEFNASIYYIIRWIGFKTIGWNIIGTTGKVLPLIVVVFLLIITFFRKNKELNQLFTAMLIGVSFYFLLSTTVHPWYVATLVLLSVFTKYKFPIVWSFMVMLSYSAYSVEGFTENLWLVAIEYFVVIGFFVWEVIYPQKKLRFT